MLSPRGAGRARSGAKAAYDARPPDPYAPTGAWRVVETAAAWCLGDPVGAAARLCRLDGLPPGGILDAVHTGAPLTLDNFPRAWNAAPFARYFLNTAMIVPMVLAAARAGTLAAYAFARFEFPGRNVRSRWCWCS